MPFDQGLERLHEGLAGPLDPVEDVLVVEGRRVASPATMASWLVVKVEEWTTARSMELYTLSDTLADDSMAPTGTYPPDSALEMVMMSGWTS